MLQWSKACSLLTDDFSNDPGHKLSQGFPNCPNSDMNGDIDVGLDSEQ